MSMKLIYLFSPSMLAAAMFCTEGRAAEAQAAPSSGTSHASALPPVAEIKTSAAEQGTMPPARVPAQEPLPDVQRVDVTGTQSDVRRDASTFKQVVGAADLVRFGDASVLDVLRRQSGIVVNSVPGQKGGQISMRGMGSAYVRILLNGEPAPAGFALDSLAPDLVERIEIIPVATAEFGMQAIAGTINVVLKRKTTQSQLKLGLYNDAERTKPQASGSFGDQRGRWSWLVTGAARKLGADERGQTRTEGYDADGPLLRTLDQFNQDRGWNWNLAPRLNLKFNGDDALTLQSFISRNHYDSAGYDRTSFLEGPVLPFANDTYVSAGTSTTMRNNLSWLQTLGEATKLELKVGHTASRRRHESSVYFAADDQGISHQQKLQVGNDNRNLSASVKLKTTYKQNHVVASGLEADLNYDEATRGNFIDSVSQLDTAGTGFDIKTRRYAMYVQDEWEVTRRWSLYLGARWEQVLLQSENNLYQRADHGRAVLSPVMQTVWRLPDTKSDQLRLGLARTWRLPPNASLLAGRTVANVNTVTTPDTSGNRELRPELAWGLDTAYERYFMKDSVIIFSGFLRKIDDVVLTKTSLIDGRWVAMPVNDGKAVSRGVEVEVKGKLGQWLAMAQSVDVRANLSRSWSSIDAVPGPDNRIGQQSPLAFNVGIDCTFQTLPISAGGSLGFVRNGVVRVSPYESTYASDNRTLEAYAVWKIRPSALLRVSAANLLRRDDTQATSYAGDGLALYKTNVRPTYTVVRAMMEFKL
jgi:outer membrane receptor for ferrienterochelin and colicin